SLLFGYFINLALPRVGELSRCASLHSLRGPSFGKSLGTVVVERMVDLVFLILVVLLAFLLQAAELRRFFKTEIGAPLIHLIEENNNLLWIVGLSGLLALILLFLFRKAVLAFIRNKTQGLGEEVLRGLLTFRQLSFARQSLFLVLSILIWTGYFCTTWFWFLAFPETQQISLAAAFTVMVTGSLVKTVPIQGGGMGAYHYLIGKLLLLY